MSSAFPRTTIINETGTSKGRAISIINFCWECRRGPFRLGFFPSWIVKHHTYVHTPPIWTSMNWHHSGTIFGAYMPGADQDGASDERKSWRPDMQPLPLFSPSTLLCCTIVSNSGVSNGLICVRRSTLPICYLDALRWRYAPRHTNRTPRLVNSPSFILRVLSVTTWNVAGCSFKQENVSFNKMIKRRLF